MFSSLYKRGCFLLLNYHYPTSYEPMEEKRYAVVTGGNKGIGFEVCRQLALIGIEVILTARNESRGLEAVEKLKASGFQNIVFHQLDIKDPTSIAELVAFIETQYKKLDILINNAGELGLVINDDKKFRDGGGLVQVMDENVHLLTGIVEEPYELAEECLKTNFYATKQITEALVPLLNLSKSPRIVINSSIFGELRWLRNEKLKEELQNIENLNEDRIDEIIQSFLRDFKASKLRENEWPLTLSAYKVSKAALNAYTRIMARKYEQILVNCVYPGYVITDMTFNMGLSTPEEGAECVVMVALLLDDGPSGFYFSQKEIAPF